MKSKRTIFIILSCFFLTVLTAVIFFSCGGRVLLPEDYHAKTTYTICIGSEVPNKFPVPGAIALLRGASIENNDQNAETAQKIAALKIRFSPDPKLQASTMPGTILYSSILDETGNTEPFYQVNMGIELKGRILKSFPGKVRYAPIDGQEFCDLLTKEIQSQIGSDVKFTIVGPELRDPQNAFWGESPWQLKKRSKN